MSEYRIARVNIEAIDDGMLVEPIYYKVFLVTQNGDWWFEAEFDSIEECEDYIELSKKYPDKSSLEKAIMVGEKRKKDEQ